MNFRGSKSACQYYAKIVREAAMRRRCIETGDKTKLLAIKEGMKAEEMVSEVEKVILDASAEKGTTGSVSAQFSDQSVFAKINELKSGQRKSAGFMSAFTDLDKIVAGFQPGSLNIIAVRPSMGKTALALNIAQFGRRNDADNHVLFFSLEMSAEQLTYRMLSAETLEIGEGVGVSTMTSGELSNYDVYAVERAVQRHFLTPSILDDDTLANDIKRYRIFSAKE